MSRETLKLKKILCNPNITVPTRLRVLECYVLLILKYGCETWTVSKEMEKTSNETEIWLLRRISRIGWTSHTTNGQLLGRRIIYLLMMTQVESKRLNYGIVFRNSLTE